jgi:hypothetical protein
MHGSAFLTFFSRRRITIAALAALTLTGAGCTRKHWRQRADNDVQGVITQKNVFPDWQVRNWHVYPDPRARFADPFRPDRPPYPPDDYAARVLSPNPQAPTKKSGAGRYDGDGYLQYLGAWDAQNRADDQAHPELGFPSPPANAPPAPPAERLPPPKPLTPGREPKAGLSASGLMPGSKVWGPALVAAALRSDAPVGPPLRHTLGDRVPHESDIILAAYEITDGDQTIPAIVVIPVAQPPAPGGNPARPNPGEPGRANPAGPNPNQPGGGQANTALQNTAQPGQVGFIAAGSGAIDFFNTLLSNQRGYRIKREQAIELGLFNSREFQDRREDMYLAALPVTLERFNFAAQGFFTEVATLDFAGRLLGRVPRNGANFGTTPSLRKLFPTGALLLVKFANQAVVDMSTGRVTTAPSNLSLNLVQPFLQGGGRAVTLEPLTLAERNLLYAIRSYARFRKLFYAAVTAGGNITNNPYGLQGLSVNLGRGIGGNLTAPSIGYLPLLLQAAQLSNQVRYVTSLEQLLKLYQAFAEGGQQSQLQVSQVEQSLISSRNSLLGSTGVNTGGGGGGGGGSSIRGYLDTLDNFKLQLGLPLTTPLDLDDTPLRPIREQLARFDAVYAQLRDIEALARRNNPAAPVAEFRPRWRRILTESPLVRGTNFAREIENRWAAWERLTADQLTTRLADLADERRRLLDRRADRQLKGVPEPVEETRRLAALQSEIDLGVFERAVRVYVAQPWLKEEGVPARAAVQAAAFRDVSNAFYQLILEGRNERLEQARRQWPKLPSVKIEGADLLEDSLDDAYTAGIQAALSNRLDLMNSRAQVVDAWRQIKVTANALQGVFNVQYNLISNTPPGGTNPVAFSGARTDHQLVFSGELPLVRRAERNNYRAALIGYQRQRRTLMAFEDNIANDVRADIREVRTLGQRYRVQQRLVEIAYFQVDNAQALLLQPPAPGAQTDAGSAAALTQQVLQAQNSLVQAQNDLYTIWVNYMVSRMIMYVDLELMQVDERGVWSNEPLPGNEDPADRPEPGPGPAPGAERLGPPRPVPGADPKQ